LEILKEERIGRVEREARVEAEPEQQVTHKVPNFERAPVNEASRIRFFAINKWLVAASIVVLLLTAGVYFWSENAAAGQGEIANATTVEISDPDLRQHLRLARMSSETLYGLAQPTWDARSAEEQRALLRKAFAMAQSLKMKRVNILNNSGRTIGYATAETTELLGSQN